MREPRSEAARSEAARSKAASQQTLLRGLVGGEGVGGGDGGGGVGMHARSSQAVDGSAMDETSNGSALSNGACKECVYEQWWEAGLVGGIHYATSAHPAEVPGILQVSCRQKDGSKMSAVSLGVRYAAKDSGKSVAK